RCIPMDGYVRREAFGFHYPIITANRHSVAHLQPRLGLGYGLMRGAHKGGIRRFVAQYERELVVGVAFRLGLEEVRAGAAPGRPRLAGHDRIITKTPLVDSHPLTTPFDLSLVGVVDEAVAAAVVLWRCG